MDPISMPKVVAMLNKINTNDFLLEEDITDIKWLFSMYTEFDLASSIDGLQISSLRIKLLDSGMDEGDLIIDKINTIAAILHEKSTGIGSKRPDVARISMDLTKESEILKKLSSLKEGDHLVVYSYRLSSDVALSIEKQAPSRIIEYATKALYQRSESPADLMRILSAANAKIVNLVAELSKGLLNDDNSLEDMEGGLKLLTQLHGLLLGASDGLNALMRNPEYKGLDCILLVQKEMSQMLSCREVLNSTIVQLEESIVLKIFSKSETDMRELTESFLLMKEEASKLEGSSLNASKIHREEKFVADFAKTLSEQAEVIKSNAAFLLEKHLDLKPEYMPCLKINGKQVEDLHHNVQGLVGEDASGIVMQMLSQEMFDHLLADLKVKYPNMPLMDLHRSSELIVDQYNQVEIVLKMACGVPSEQEEKTEISSLFLIKRSIQIPLMQLQIISKKKDLDLQKFKVVDLISPQINAKDLEFAGGYEHCMMALLDQFSQKKWGKSTGKMLAKTSREMDRNLGIDGKEAFRKILRGEEVELDEVEIKGKTGVAYSIPKGLQKDLVRFPVLRLNGEVIFSNVSPQFNDPCTAFEKIAKAFNEDPSTAVLARIAPIALTQTGTADITTGFGSAAMHADRAVTGDWDERLLDINISGDGILTMVVKAIRYEIEPDLHPTYPIDGVMLYRKLQMPIAELKDAIEHSNDRLLVNLTGEDKISTSLLLRKPGQTVEDVPQIINSQEYAFKIDEKDAYELLEHFN